MSRKENRQGIHKNPHKIISTTDLRKVLDTISPNTGWKNKSSKLQMSKPLQTMGATNRMTEDDIEKMFSHSNEKKYVYVMDESVKMGWERRRVKDFIAEIPFLGIEDFHDRLLSGFEPYALGGSKHHPEMMRSQNRK